MDCGGSGQGTRADWVGSRRRRVPNTRRGPLGDRNLKVDASDAVTAACWDLAHCPAWGS